MHKKIAFIIVAIVVSGCQAYKSTTFDESPKRVGVISLMGSEIGLYHRGMTVFGNQVNNVEIEGVDLNDIFQEKIGEALQYDYEVVDLDFNQEEMFALLTKDKPASFSSFMFGENKFMYLEEDLKNISSENDLDAIVLMAPVKAAVQSADFPRVFLFIVQDLVERSARVGQGFMRFLFLSMEVTVEKLEVRY